MAFHLEWVEPATPIELRFWRLRRFACRILTHSPEPWHTETNLFGIRITWWRCRRCHMMAKGRNWSSPVVVPRS